jgi:hypothetical protein
VVKDLKEVLRCYYDNLILQHIAMGYMVLQGMNCRANSSAKWFTLSPAIFHRWPPSEEKFRKRTGAPNYSRRTWYDNLTLTKASFSGSCQASEMHLWFFSKRKMWDWCDLWYSALCDFWKRRNGETVLLVSGGCHRTDGAIVDEPTCEFEGYVWNCNLVRSTPRVSSVKRYFRLGSYPIRRELVDYCPLSPVANGI